MDTLRAQPGAVVEVLGWDEAFVGIRTDDPETWAREAQAAVRAATRLSCAVGIGDTKVRAKIATQFGKPGGIFRLTAKNWFEVMGDRPTIALWGIGKRISARLTALGIRTVRDLAQADEDELINAFGPHSGRYLRLLGRGISSAVVDDTPWVARAHGHEMTYQRDLVDPTEIARAIAALADQVVADLHREQRPCARVHLKVRFVPFFTYTRIRKLPEPTFDPAVIAQTALDLLDALDDHRPIRLLGVRGEMVPPEGGY
jgi:DNA polymerase IV